jgi:4-hydroxy-tetrahydrodipicolinate synthase
MAGFGVSVALATPFTEEGVIDRTGLARHAGTLIEGGADGVTLFGTTGEGASIGAGERSDGLAALRLANIPPERITLGVCATAVRDALVQIEQGLAAGISQFLLPPPYYFAGAPEEGLFSWFSDLFSRAPPKARAILYHIPQVTGVPLPATLAHRLAEAFPGRIVALKDSSGDWATAEAFLTGAGVPVLIGDERLLHRAVPRGCGGAITGMGNLAPERIGRILATGDEDPALSAMVARLSEASVIPGIKVLLAQATGISSWENVRPPLAPLTPAARTALRAAGPLPPQAA